ncbi:hypothetical protein FRC03_007102 [Tulasnella sp. 419]|nr:hypothetical protein FRC03_007102 [Tulasnella sp. 419]
MTPDGPKISNKIGPGVYCIESMASSTSLNLIRHSPDAKPAVCVWQVHESPSQNWLLENGQNGYLIKNVATGIYLTCEGKPEPLVKAIGATHGVEWQIEPKTDSQGQFEIRFASNRKLGLGIEEDNTTNGAQLVLNDAGGYTRQLFRFHPVKGDTLTAEQSYIGPVPPGKYWIGQPSENGGPWVACKAPTTAALSASAPESLVKGGTTIPVHLSAVGVGRVPLKTQVWSLECGIRGYRLKHVDSDTYLNLVNREPVLERGALGPSSSTEWELERVYGNKLPAYKIRPSVDLSLLMGVTKGDSFNRLRTKPLIQFGFEMLWAWVYLEWRLEPVEMSTLDSFQ